MTTKDNRLDLAKIRERLDSARGKGYWRALDEIAESEGFEEFLHREFPRQASEWNDPVGRRRFMQLMGASLALAGFSACVHQPKETIVPYVRQPEDMTLGKPLYFATAMPLGGLGTGLLIQSREGRPVKIEGNPDHPASLGATDAIAQASLLTLYDPDRSQSITYLGEIRPWSGFLGALTGALAAQRGRQGAGLRILTGTVTSPTLADQLQQILKAYPAAKWHQYEPVGAHAARAVTEVGANNAVYSFDKADVILSLGANFLGCGPGTLKYTREYSQKRKIGQGQTPNRLYVVETAMSNTGAVADHRLALAPSEIEAFTDAVASAMGAGGGESRDGSPHSDWIRAVAADLQAHKSSSIVIAGEGQPASVHVTARAMNQALGNIGSTVNYQESVEAAPVNQVSSLRDLVQDMTSGGVDILLILGGNPVFDAPADLDFKSAMGRVAFRAHSSLFDDETSEQCQWHIPMAHYLESWSDIRAFDGTTSIIQPLIAPLYHGKTAHEILAAFSQRPDQSGYDIVRAYWQARLSGDFEMAWRKAVHDGLVPNSAKNQIVYIKSGEAIRNGAAVPGSSSQSRSGTSMSGQLPSTNSPTTLFGSRELDAIITKSPYNPNNGVAPILRSGYSAAPGTIEVSFQPDPAIYDGQFANNGWLQEMPKPVTNLTWDNAVLMSPAMAQRLGVSYEVARTGGEHGQVLADMVEVERQGRKLQAPAWIMPGHADNCVTIHLGYGRTRSGKVGTGTGFNAYAIRTTDAFLAGSGFTIKKIDGSYEMACTQFHNTMEGRDLARKGTLAEYNKKPDFAQDDYDRPEKQKSMYPGFEYKDYAWGMAIDLNQCVGCNACIVACQSENNIPVVGKEEVTHGREMHWLRVDRYFEGGLDNPDAYFQPVMCQHCENAPCELVCPVQATVHSAEGLNDMVYNRCVGTRYCSNNCPYKVRRFNFLQYADWDTPSLKLLANPEVTVRSRGVMEKCTFCVQRITHAKIDAEKEGRKVQDGEIVTACQAVCPAEAITFGDINDPNSRVAQLKADSRNYGLLADLNTRPRASYLAVVRNPNPELEKA